MQPPAHADRPTDVGTLDALISQALQLRGKLDEVRREAPTGDGDGSTRWRRALCELAVHHLRDLGEHLGQLREEIATPAGAGGQVPGASGGAGRTTPAGAAGSADQAERDAPAGSGHSADRGGARPAPQHPPAGRTGSGPGRAGSAEWNLVTDEIAWSEEMYRIFGRDPADEPLPLDELPAWLLPEDQGRVAAMVTSCLVDGRPIDGEFRIVRPDGGVRTVHLVGEPELDADGSTLAMWAVVRDVSELRRSQRSVRETRDSLRRSRHLAHAEQRVAAKLQQAVLPPWLGPLGDGAQSPVAALDLAARYLPCGTGPSLGGDWYDALELPDGTALLTVGDLSGEGVPAASAMAMLLGALRGMAVAGVQPGPMLRWLNQLVDRTAQPALGSALCCRYDPGESTLTWAQAGHPAPVLFRDGEARVLRSPEGSRLGTTAGAGYEQRSERLEPGDVLVLYTPGLVRGGAGAEPPEAADDRARLLTALAPRLADTRGAVDCVRMVVEEFGGADHSEDGCVLVARVR